MSQFNFTYASEDGTILDYSCECETWYNALDHFVKFLRGAGYQIFNDSVGINTLNHLGVEDDPNLNNITTFIKE